MITHYVQHKIVPQTRSAINSDQYAIFQGCTETNGQPVGSGARSLISWPVECNEASPFAKDVHGSSLGEQKMN